MKDFKADILAINKRGRIYFYIIISLIFLIVAALAFFQIIPFELSIFSTVAWLYAVIKYFLQSRKHILKKPVADLLITSDYISVADKRYSLNEIKSINITTSGWRSYKRSNDRNMPVAGLHNGDENFITIGISNKKDKYEFLLTSKEHWQLLREHVISWYCKNVNVTELGIGGKTYGLENLKYREIQEFKMHIASNKTSAL